MKIIAGSTIIMATPIIDSNVAYNGRVVESIRLMMDQLPTQEQIQDLVSHPWQEYDDNDVLLSTVEGYNTVHLMAITLLKVPDVLRENEELKAALIEKEAELQAALALLETPQN